MTEFLQQKASDKMIMILKAPGQASVSPDYFIYCQFADHGPYVFERFYQMPDKRSVLFSVLNLKARKQTLADLTLQDLVDHVNGELDDNISSYYEEVKDMTAAGFLYEEDGQARYFDLATGESAPNKVFAEILFDKPAKYSLQYFLTKKIPVNVKDTIAAGQPVTAETLQKAIDRGDGDLLDFDLIKELVEAGKADPNEAGKMRRTVIAAKSEKRRSHEAPIESLLIDYRKKAAEGKFEHVSFRGAVEEQLITALTSHLHPNALLVGEAGVGKTAIVEDLALSLYEKRAPEKYLLGDAHIFELPIANLVSGSGMVGMLEKKVNDVIAFASKPENNVILFIDEIHQLFNRQAEGKIAEILKPALARGDLHVIGATTTQEVKDLANNPAFKRRFTQIKVPEFTDEETLALLKEKAPALTGKGKVEIPEAVFPKVVHLSSQMARVLGTHQPDAAITVLDQAITLAKIRVDVAEDGDVPCIVDQAILDQVAETILGSPAKMDLSTIKKCQKLFDQELIGQKAAKDSILKMLKSQALGLEKADKPRSFLFAGPSGTGKTEAAKLLAKGLFGDERKMVYINMTEYSIRGTITRLLGSPRGYIGSDSKQPLPLDSLKTSPCQIVLLDEFEKGSEEVQRVFMQALDEGYIRDAMDDYIDFSHAIVIATTNAGIEEMSEPTVGFGGPQIFDQKEISQILARHLPIELVNRFEDVVMFQPITQDEYRQILALNYGHLVEQAAVNRPDLSVVPKQMDADDPFIKKLAANFDPLKNARPAKRTVKAAMEEKMLEQYGAETIDLSA
ncbi:MAG: AAA family ATPase [Lactobacillus equicursoris]|uniref:AAA family ATPase n=1 Tax=Lactobacillus equicursoris TaxID=420645 RepID=UPI00242B17EA|nr:AAA family ATPase [Lactobacillus equicursoris]MDD6407743.1 AAA family ATPase [Lactobacillus equicursoris]